MLHEEGVDLLVCMALGFELRWRVGAGDPTSKANLDVTLQQLLTCVLCEPCVGCECGACSHTSMRFA